MKTLLPSQFVSFDPLSDEAWQVVVGSGTGMIASDEMSCVDFYDRAELPSVFTDAVQARFDISLYERFKDDLILAMGAVNNSCLSSLCLLVITS